MFNKRILDYSCGLGGNFKFIAKRGRYFGVDILAENIPHAEKRYAGSFQIINGRTLPFADAYFAARLVENGYTILSQRKVRGMEAVVYARLLAVQKRKKFFVHQTVSSHIPQWSVAFIWLFDARLFFTPLRFLFFLYWLTLPIGWLICRFFPKSIAINV